MFELMIAVALATAIMAIIWVIWITILEWFLG